MTLDGVQKPKGERYSTRFNSYEDLMRTREDTLAEIERQTGVDLSRPPGPGDRVRHELSIDHHRPIDDGFVGQGTRSAVPDLFHHGKQVKAYTEVDAISDVTGTRTVIRWDAGRDRWDVKQHFPLAEGWDDATKRYDPPLTGMVR